MALCKQIGTAVMKTSFSDMVDALKSVEELAGDALSLDSNKHYKMTLPSNCWPFSRRAAIVLPTANPLPLRV